MYYSLNQTIKLFKLFKQEFKFISLVGKGLLRYGFSRIRCEGNMTEQQGFYARA
jgi:hypothetical protein